VSILHPHHLTRHPSTVGSSPEIDLYALQPNDLSVSLSVSGQPRYCDHMTFVGFDRITTDPHLLGGKPCVRGMRLSVQRVLEILADNPSWDDLRADYPELEPEDIHQALAFAAATINDDRIIPLAGTGT
jgi:uncharacterized protein (DUF433 family)